MAIKELFQKNKGRQRYVTVQSKTNVPDGLFTKCGGCHEMVLTEDLYYNEFVCPKCGHYEKVNARTRLEQILDRDSFEEWDTGIIENNPCNYKGYEEKLEYLKESTGLDEAVVTGQGKLGGNRVAIGVCDTQFLMGSMGHVVGEKITRLFERATKETLPVILFTCSGGARMQEGIVSLMQMAKTSAAIKRHDEAGNLYITVLTDPTTGGVTASFAMLGDIILAEPGALIGFAGPRVIKQTIGQELPEGFQRAEFLKEHGFVDAVVKRPELRDTLNLLVKMHVCTKDQTSSQLTEQMRRYESYLNDIYGKKIDIDAEERKVSDCLGDTSELTPWDRVQIARSNSRPTALDYINRLTKEFVELHGDRGFGDDGAMIGGIAMFGKLPVTVIGQQKGTSTKENILRNFGMPYPEGYRKALRLMKQAEKFKRPVITFVDTPGAFCGIGAEERGQGEAIAKNLFEMASITVPILSIVTGEGGSGGALALAVANEVWMMENSIYSVLSPEGFASILWKDSSKAKEAAEQMGMTAADLKKMGIIERIIPEFPVVSEDNINHVTLYMKRKIADFLINYISMTGEELANQRYDRFRKF
ncbi:MAG: acetyl-CoA carboxylase carboxyltransferase subunit alpha [Eubacteriales bacterium]|nr:acetyl-CoA carboxylase carboxyltransferase subunit alpha [Eubacteriales bacterium]